MQMQMQEEKARLADILDRGDLCLLVCLLEFFDAFGEFTSNMVVKNVVWNADGEDAS